MTLFHPYEEHLEVIVPPNHPRVLLDEPQELWHAVVNAGGGQILSMIQNDLCRAYLLSSSSLFVFRKRVVLITCGPADVLRAGARLLAELEGSAIGELYYTYRRSPHDEKNLPLARRELAWGLLSQATRTETCQPHHVQIQLVHTPCPAQFKTQQVQLYFNLTRDQIGSVSALVPHLEPHFQCDEHHFSPEGYSLNAISRTGFVTIHASPEHGYLSFEHRNVEPHAHAWLVPHVERHLRGRVS